ncbi:MAG TPA: DUF4157 domain-containing protein [Pyrinomonadaceae bacterium]|jgi:hypothetical protein
MSFERNQQERNGDKRSSIETRRKPALREMASPDPQMMLMRSQSPAVRLNSNPDEQSMLAPKIWQAKLSVSQPGDEYEQEADRLAEQVMRMPTPALRLQRKVGCGGQSEGDCAQSSNKELLVQRRASSAQAPSAVTAPSIVHDALRSPGQALDTSTRTFFESRFKQDFSQVRVHTDERAASSARAVNALAYTVGTHVVFGAGRYAPQTSEGSSLLAHELVHVAQASRDVRPDQAARGMELAHTDHPAEREAEGVAERGGRPFYRASRPLVFRQVAPRPVARRTADQILGVAPSPGMTLAEFRAYTREQADWFVEPTLSAGNVRNNLWSMLLIAEEGPHILSGIGDLKIPPLLGVSGADWPVLRTFCRATHSTGHTVRIFPPLPPLADRIALGRTLSALEAVIPAAVLEVTVSQSQLLEVQTLGRMPVLTAYWRDYQPHLEQTYTPTPGGRGPEFERVLTFLTSLGAAGLAPLNDLRGANANERWVRNLHRFPLPMLLRLVANLADRSGTKRLVLVLHTGHDAPGAFQESARLFSDLVLLSPNNLVLMIEGATSLAAITARIPTITSTWGENVGGTRRISQVLIAGHGSAQTVGMAGTGAPNVNAGAVSYPEESLDISNPASRATTQALLDALLTNMPPATARILYAGCLVGSTHVAAGTAAANIPAALAGQQSLGAFTNTRAVAAGIPAGRVQAARASVALGNATSLFDPATGQLGLSYPFDPNAFGSASSYAASGHEPEGVLRAAVEVGAVNRVTAETLLRTRLAMPAVAGDWYDTITRLLVGLALPAVAGAGVDLQKVNELANVAQIPFLAFWPQFGISVAHFTTMVNPQGFALSIYNGVAATPQYTNPAAHHTERMRIIVDQGWLAQAGAGQVPTLLAGILATNLPANVFADFLERTVLAPHAALLLPPAGPFTPARIRLALAWLSLDRTKAEVRSFLTAQVVRAPNTPAAFTPAVSAEIAAAGLTDREILDQLGFAPTATAAPAAPGGPSLPLANLAFPGSATNTALVTGRPYMALIIVPNAIVWQRSAAGVWTNFQLPSPNSVRVTGIMSTNRDWAVVDIGGQLRFILKSELSPPPP